MKIFSKARANGYDRDEVDDFLERIAADFTILLQENEDLKDRLNQCNNDNKAHYDISADCIKYPTFALVPSGNINARIINTALTQTVSNEVNPKNRKTEHPLFNKLPDIKGVTTGDIIRFGRYKQNNNTNKEVIEWHVLAKKENKVLLISKYGLDCQPYNSSKKGVTWEDCSLRKWLNDTFIDSAFTTIERSMIRSTNVTADNNPKYGTNPGNATKDKVFLLSVNEVSKYLPLKFGRQCKPTKATIAKGAYTDDKNGNCWWWLRTPGSSQNSAAGVYDDGTVYPLGDFVNKSNVCVRPAMWINMES